MLSTNELPGLLASLGTAHTYTLEQIFFEENKDLGSIKVLGEPLQVHGIVLAYYNAQLKTGTIITLGVVASSNRDNPNYLSLTDHSPLRKKHQLQQYVLPAISKGAMSRTAIDYAEKWYAALRTFIEQYNTHLK